MKTLFTKKSELEQDLDTLIKRDQVLIKASIGFFGLVLNICCFQLFF